MLTLKLVSFLVITMLSLGYVQAVRYVRQTARYGVANYRPMLPVLNAVRGGPVANSKSSVAGARPVQGVGAFSFGGVAGGRPAFASNYGYNMPGVRVQASVNRPQAVRPEQSAAYRTPGVPGRPLIYSYN